MKPLGGKRKAGRMASRLRTAAILRKYLQEIGRRGGQARKTAAAGENGKLGAAEEMKVTPVCERF